VPNYAAFQVDIHRKMANLLYAAGRYAETEASIRKALGARAGNYREALELSAELYRELADSAGYQAG
jgi:hypothetical protein